MYVCGVDIGTTGTKAIVVDEKGIIIGHAYVNYPLHASADGSVEQDAEDWRRSTVAAVRGALHNLSRQSVRALCLSTQGGSAVLCNLKGVAFMNAHSWMDTRPASFCNTVTDQETVYMKSGWKLCGAMLPMRALWFQKHRPDIWKKAKKYLTTVDYMNYWLTGHYIIDQTNAGMNQAMNLYSMKWDRDLLAMGNIPPSMMPEILPSGEVIGSILPEAAKELGLSEEVIVVSGGHDQYCAALGAGAVESGDVILSGGTAWVLLEITAEPVFDTKDWLAIGNHVISGKYGLLSSLPVSGAAMEWYRWNFAVRVRNEGKDTPEGFDVIDTTIAERILQNPNLFFFPQFSGRSFPRWKASQKASFLGISLEHDSYDMALSIMEGIVFDMVISLEAFAAKGWPAQTLKLLGGAAKSRCWSDIISNVTNLPIMRFKNAEPACMGAAALAGAAIGMYRNPVEGAELMAKGLAELMPAPSGPLFEHYRKKYEKYKQLLPLVEALY
jgi:sugar (pentulose or hexulose) kinase